jgi:hypothetical protein
MSKQTSNKFSPEVRSRAVRLVLDRWRLGSGAAPPALQAENHFLAAHHAA